MQCKLWLCLLCIADWWMSVEVEPCLGTDTDQDISELGRVRRFTQQQQIAVHACPVWAGFCGQTAAVNNEIANTDGKRNKPQLMQCSSRWQVISTLLTRGGFLQVITSVEV